MRFRDSFVADIKRAGFGDRFIAYSGFFGNDLSLGSEDTDYFDNDYPRWGAQPFFIPFSQGLSKN